MHGPWAPAVLSYNQPDEAPTVLAHVCDLKAKCFKVKVWVGSHRGVTTNGTLQVGFVTSVP